MVKCLVLVPTPLELRKLRPELERMVATYACGVELCGFGLVAAAVRAAALLASHRPKRVILAGIAGAYSKPTDELSLEVGQAYRFDQVACYGIGVGAGEHFQTAGELGWLHLPGRLFIGELETEPIGDALDLRNPNPLPSANRLQLLSCCAASANAHDADCKRAKFPQAAAEDMEGFAVAMACNLAGIPCEIIRGISNLAGDRHHQHWKISEALEAVGCVLESSLERSEAG